MKPSKPEANKYLSAAVAIFSGSDFQSPGLEATMADRILQRHNIDPSKKGEWLKVIAQYSTAANMVSKRSS